MAERELLRETEWSRFYRDGWKTIVYESKFQSGALQISAASLRERWPGWLHNEQIDFATAFQAKPVLTADDQEILTFLIEVGSEDVCSTIAYLLPKYEDRERAVSFLVERVRVGRRYAASYYGALERIGDARAIPPLRHRYEEYRRTLTPFEHHGLHSELSDYDACCRALWKLDGSAEYEEALKELLAHPDESVRRRVSFLLADPVM
jgi:HEAT repeat protein